jgi:hypothetical protein
LAQAVDERRSEGIAGPDCICDVNFVALRFDVLVAHR